MPEDKKDPFSEFGGKEISSTEKNTPSSDPFSEFGGSSIPEKKKSSPLASPSVSEGGTSGLTATPSVPLNTPTETYTVKPDANFNPFSKSPNEVKGQTALGNKMPASNELKAIGTASGGKSTIADSNITRNEFKIKRDAETKSMVDAYEKYKQTKSSEQANLGQEPFALDDNKNTINFYMSHIKETNPEEYNYMIQRQESLSKDKQKHEALGQAEDVEEDDLMIQKTHAELLQKALALKTRVMSGKYDLASNALKDNYSDVIKDFNESTQNVQDIETKIQGIDDFINKNYQVDENGNIITTPLNKKEVEDLLKKRTEFENEYKLNSEKVNSIQQNEDFSDALSLLDETQKTYDALEKTYTNVKNNNPDAFKGLPSYRKQLINEELAQKQKDIIEKATGGDYGIGESVTRGVTGIASALSFIPKSLSLNDDYGWTDKLYDVVKSNVDDFDAENNPLPTGYDKPVYEDGQWNLKYLPGKIAGTLTEMAPIIAITAATEGATAGLLARMGASGELSTTMGAFAGEYTAVANDFYDEAKSSRMSEKDAMTFSRSAATTQAVLGALSPDIKLARRNAYKEGLEEYAKQIAKGATVKDALKESMKGFSEKLIKEVPQENLQTWAEIQDKNEMYEKMGLSEKIQNSVKKDLIETTILSSIVTLGLGLNGISTPSRMQKESLFMAASQPEEIMKAAQNMLVADKISQQEFNDITMKVAKANFALSKMDKSLSAEQKSKALIPLMEKLDLKEEAAKLDDSQKELLDEKIAKKDAEIKGIVSSPSDEEIENANEAEAFFNRIKEQHTKDNAAKVEIPASENKMQKDGLFEVDDSQKSQPIELSTQPENVINKPGDIVEVRKQVAKDGKVDFIAYKVMNDGNLLPIGKVSQSTTNAKSIEAEQAFAKLFENTESTVNSEKLKEIQNKKEAEKKKADIERRRQEEKNVPDRANILNAATVAQNSFPNETKEDLQKRLKEEINSINLLVKRLLEKGIDKNKIIKQVKDYISNGNRVISRREGLSDFATYLVENNTQISTEEEINDNSDAEYVEAVKKGEMTKEQAMQALEEVGRKGSSAYTELAALEQKVSVGGGNSALRDVDSNIVEEPNADTKDVESKIAEIEKAIKDNKQNFFNEKIDNNTYWKNQDALEKDLDNLQNPSAQKTETLTPEEVVAKETPTIEDVKSLEPEVKTEEVVPPATEKVKEATPKKASSSPKTATQISAEQNMIEEEDVLEDEIPSSIKNAKTDEDKAKAEEVRKTTSTKMALDKEAFKRINEETYKGKSKAELKDLVEKKYIGTLERAYKNKVDGIISGPEYTKYRNELNDIVTGKLAEYSDKKVKGGGQEGESLRKGELKAQVSALGEKVKEKLLGQGFKNVALSSAAPITPKMIEDLVNLTVKGVHLGIDLGYGAREATARAITAIKAHPKYQQIINSGMSEKDFEKAVVGEFSKVKSTYTPPVVVEEKVTENPVEPTTSEKNTQTEGGASVPETETTENKGTSEPSSGKKNERMGSKRMKESSKYKEVFSRVSEEAKSYDKMDLNESLSIVKDKIKEFEDAGSLEQLAETLLSEDKKSPFPDKLNHAGLIYTMDRVSLMAESEENIVVQNGLYNLAAKLSEKAMIEATNAGQTLAAMSLSAKLMPTSKAGMRAFTKSNLAMTQKSYLNKNDRKVLNDVVNDLNSLPETNEVKQLKEIINQEAEKIASNKIDSMAEAMKGKEWVKSVSDVIKSAKEKSPENC